MNWESPQWLWGLIGPGAALLVSLVALLSARRRGRAAAFPAIHRVQAVGARVQPVSPRSPVRRPWLMLLAIALLLAALARPRWGVIEKPMVEHAREVMIAIDLSRSMLVEDVAPTRLDRAKLLVRGLLDGLKGERVGLVVFAGTSFVQVPLSVDYQIVYEFLSELSPAYMPQGGTDYDGMLRAAIGGFSTGANSDRYLIILSDGGSQTGEWRAQIDTLKENRITVLALGVGTSRGGFIPDPATGFVKDTRGAVVLSRLETDTLRDLATATGGAFRDSSVWVDLPGLLAETVARGRATEVTQRVEVEHIERFQWMLAPAVVLALLALWREAPVKVRPRAVQRRTTPSRAPAHAAGAIAVVMGAVLLLDGIAPPLRAALRIDPPPAPADAAPPDRVDAVRETVARLSALDHPTAGDWRELAERTLAWGNPIHAAGQPVEPGPVHDALAAVDAGERADAAAADWAGLRAALQKLIEPPPPQQEPQQDQQQEQDEDEKKQDEQKQENQQDPSQQQHDQQQQEKQEQQQQQEQDDSNPSSPQSQQDPKQQQQEKEKPKPQTEEGRMGELADEKEPEADPQGEQKAAEQKPKEPQTRRIAGRRANDTQPMTPEQAMLLQRLREATDKDSPARLYELLEGETEKSEKEKGNDW